MMGCLASMLMLNYKSCSHKYITKYVGIDLRKRFLVVTVVKKRVAICRVLGKVQKSIS